MYKKGNIKYISLYLCEGVGVSPFDQNIALLFQRMHLFKWISWSMWNTFHFDNICFKWELFPKLLKNLPFPKATFNYHLSMSLYPILNTRETPPHSYIWHKPSKLLLFWPHFGEMVLYHFVFPSQCADPTPENTLVCKWECVLIKYLRCVHQFHLNKKCNTFRLWVFFCLYVCFFPVDNEWDSIGSACKVLPMKLNF